MRYYYRCDYTELKTIYNNSFGLCFVVKNPSISRTALLTFITITKPAKYSASLVTVATC